MTTTTARKPITPMDARSAAIARAITLLSQTDASSTSSAVVALARAADRLYATAALLLATSPSVDHASGLTTETILRLDAHLVDADARRLCGLADTLRQMPGLARSLQDGHLNASVAAAISSETRRVTASGRRQIDQHLTSRAPQPTGSEPEQLVEEVRDLVWRDRDDLQRAREDRHIDGNFLAFQASLDGGGRLYGHADPIAFATITTSLDTAAGPPQPDRTRAQARMDALINLCEGSQGSEAGSGRRTRPRFLIATSLQDLADLGASEAARLLGATPGRPQRITPLAAQILGCDADLTPIIFHQGQPIGIGDTRATIPAKIRAALIARDGGCRFPGCHAPAAWTDAHHLRARQNGGDATIDNLMLLCRRCHRRVHRYRWKIALQADGTATFTNRGKRWTTHPRARPPDRE